MANFLVRRVVKLFCAYLLSTIPSQAKHLLFFVCKFFFVLNSWLIMFLQNVVLMGVSGVLSILIMFPDYISNVQFNVPIFIQISLPELIHLYIFL